MMRSQSKSNVPMFEVLEDVRLRESSAAAFVCNGPGLELYVKGLDF